MAETKAKKKILKTAGEKKTQRNKNKNYITYCQKLCKPEDQRVIFLKY